MKRLVFPLIIFTVLVLGGSAVAEEVVNFNNDICPVMGRKVNGVNYAVYNGIRYELCCGSCENIFPKDPEKYIEMLPNKGQIVELKNETCPVMGGKTNEAYYAIYNGYKVNFCCPDCINAFKKDPNKYLRMLVVEEGSSATSSGKKEE